MANNDRKRRTREHGTKPVSFAHLRRLLLDLRFTEARLDDCWRFEHDESGAVFLFRPYGPDEIVSTQDVGSTRMHLDWRGLMSPTAFDERLAKTPA